MSKLCDVLFFIIMVFFGAAAATVGFSYKTLFFWTGLILIAVAYILGALREILNKKENYEE